MRSDIEAIRAEYVQWKTSQYERWKAGLPNGAEADREVFRLLDLLPGLLDEIAALRRGEEPLPGLCLEPNPENGERCVWKGEHEGTPHTWGMKPIPHTDSLSDVKS